MDLSKRSCSCAFLCLFAVISVLGTACREGRNQGAPDRTDGITVFAAASLADVITEAARRFEQDRGVEVRTSFAASSTLARQIDAGAPADIYISADREWMDYLEERGRIADDSRVDLVANRLVLIAPREREDFNPAAPLVSQFEGRLAIADPTHVPAGRYAQAALEHFNWWSDVADRLSPALDVRAALRLVEMGEASLGIVYRSDAVSSDRVEIVWTFPVDSHPSIVYPAVAVSDAPLAREFIEFLRSDEIRDVFEKAGFTPMQ